ncbi:hypothetical protein NQ317_017938 [Molorchus minor]|uniref:Endonuclease/exonuclease/phosphatase domain-containing protein n=1 Tax=Molorchus minor TaxID=1323400 RepID=A0ABQ9JSH8_9CUCU|nr:hypothetical protein NQ317_017938 [Molorchus minor]
MSDFSEPQKEFIKGVFIDLNNTINEKAEEIRNELKDQIGQIKEDIGETIGQLKQKIKDLQIQNETLQENIIYLERKSRKNNLIIFGTKNARECPIVVEFISFQKKLLVLKNAHKLKGKNIFIARDQSKKDREESKILINHQKKARAKGQTAYIKGRKLIVGEEEYTTKQLVEEDDRYEDVTSDSEEEEKENTEEKSASTISKKRPLGDTDTQKKEEGDRKRTKPEQRQLRNKSNRVKPRSTNFCDNNISVIAAYRSPATCPNEFVNCLDQYLQNNKNSDNYSILIGDINIDIYQPTEDASHNYLNVLDAHGYKSHINGITRELNNSYSCLDHIFIKSQKNCVNDMTIPCIIQSKITDHYIVTSQIILHEEKIKKSKNIQQIKYINYKKVKKRVINNKLE